MHTNMKHEHPLDHHCTKSTEQKHEAQTVDTELCANVKHKQLRTMHTESCCCQHSSNSNTHKGPLMLGHQTPTGLHLSNDH